MAERHYTVSSADTGRFQELLERYRPRLSVIVSPGKRWTSEVTITVSGDDPYLSVACAAADDLEEDLMLKRAW